VKAQYSAAFALLLQLPFDPSPEWLEALQNILSLGLALVIRGYLILVLVGFMVYATGLSDGLAKFLVGAGVVLYIGGPYLIGLAASLSGITGIDLNAATSAWFTYIGMTDAEFVELLVTLGDVLLATCALIGAILYFNPTSNDLEARGKSLMVRAVMFAPILVFFHITPWI
jgi:hypothetical protein